MTVIRFLVVLFITTCFEASAQTIIRLVDVETGGPVADAIVQYGWQFNESAVSDKSGIVEIEGYSNKLPVQVRHLNYKLYADTIHAKNAEIFLAPRSRQLEEIVVTGQYGRQTLKESVFNVRTISAKTIEQQGAGQIEEVLRNQLNIQFQRDNALGSSGIALGGMSGQNIKVLINGVPISGRSGVANEIDLSQIDINSVERIEIVEGPMSVYYGADALAGVINIITKEGNSNQPLVQFDLQSETVGREYSFLDQGIHNYGVRLSLPVKQRINIGAHTRMNRFGGWQGKEEGRERAWHPKDQLFYGGEFSYQAEHFKLSYQYDKLNETIYNPSNNVITPTFRDPYVIEEEYISQRDFHQLHFDYELNNWFWQFAASFTDFQRRTREFSTNMITDSETDIASGADTVSYQSFFGRNTASYSGFKDLTIQLGADVNYETADGSRLQDDTQPQWNIGLFAGTEWKLNDRLLVRPGIRFTYNTVFNTVPTPALNARYQFGKTTLRLGWGMGYRAPSPRELYHEFIDSNHNIIGNEELTPEYSQNVNLQVTQSIFENFSLEGRFFYNTIRDRISLVQKQSGTNPGFTYANIRDWANHGLNMEASFDRNSWSTAIGFSYIGIAQNLETDNAEVPEYVYSPELIARMNWTPGSNSFSVFYKYTGPNQQYRINDEGEAVLGGIEGFHWMDITWQRHWTSFLSSTIGIKNVFDVTALNNSGGTGGVHGGGDTLVQGYGTSVFAKIQLKFFNYK